MENKPLSNDDFRNFLESKTNSNNKKSTTTTKKKTKWIDRDYEYYQTAPEKVDPNYKDRAKERRQGDDEDNENKEKNLDKKGLDFNLLYSTKQQLKLNETNNNENNNEIDKEHKQQQKKEQQQQDRDKLNKIKCKSNIGNSILKVLQQKPNLITSSSSSSKGSKSNSNGTIDQRIKQHNKEIFQMNRMLYLFDLDPDFPQHIPTTILNSKEDCPPVKKTMSANINNQLLKKLTNFYHPGKEVIFNNNNNNNREIDSIYSDDDGDDNDNKQKQQQQQEKSKKEIESDDDNIFSDTEEYVCETKPVVVVKKDNNSKEAVHNYFGKNKDDDYSNEFKPIGKENDENDEIVNNSKNEKDVKIYISKTGELISKTKQDENNEIEQQKKKEVKSDDDNIFSDIESDNDKNTDNNTNIEIPKNNDEEEDDDDEYVYPNTDANYEQHEREKENQDYSDDDNMKLEFQRQQQQQQQQYDNNSSGNEEDDDDDDDEYAYPNTDENFEKHEKEYKEEQDKRFNEESSSDDKEDNIISLDTNNESLKRKLLGQDSLYGGDDDYYPQFTGFDRERGEKPKLSIDEMYKFKKDNKSSKDNKLKKLKIENQKIGTQMQKINQILKDKAKESGEKFVDIFGTNEKKKKK